MRQIFKIIIRYTFFLLIFFGGGGELWAQEADPNVILSDNCYHIYELSQDWQVYDATYQAFVPYIRQRHQNSKTMSFWLEVKKYRKYKMILYTYGESYMLVDNQLSKRFRQEGWVHLSLDSMYFKYKKEKIFCTFYDDQVRLPLPYLFIGKSVGEIAAQDQIEELDQEAFILVPRVAYPLKYFVILMLLLILGFYAFVVNYYPRGIRSYFGYRSSLSVLSNKDQGLIYKPFSLNNLIFIFSHVSVIAFVYVVIGETFASFRSNYEARSLIALLWDWLFWYGILASLLFIKNLIVRSLGGILNISKSTGLIHFFEYIRLSTIFYSIIFIILMVVVVNYLPLKPVHISVLAYILGGFHLFQAILVSFYVIKQIRFRSLYLFYYLCITELIPLLIGIRLLLI